MTVTKTFRLDERTVADLVRLAKAQKRTLNSCVEYRLSVGITQAIWDAEQLLKPRRKP